MATLRDGSLCNGNKWESLCDCSFHREGSSPRSRLVFGAERHPLVRTPQRIFLEGSGMTRTVQPPNPEQG